MSTKTVKTVKPGDPFYYKYRNIFVGIFVLIPLLVIPALLIFALVKSEILEQWVEVYIQCETGTGLMRTTPVNVLGNPVGRVHSVELNEEGYVDVVLRVKRRFSRFIHKDSKATIKQKNLVFGDWEVDLTMGSKLSPTVEDGDTLEVDYPVRLDRLVTQITDMITPLEEIFQSVAKGEGILKHILGSDTLMPKTTAVFEKINRLFGEVDHTINKANIMIEKLTDFSDHGKATIDSITVLFGSVVGLIDKIDAVVVNIDSLIVGFGTLPKDASTILDLLQRDLQEAGILLKGVQNHWLLRRTIRKQKKLQEKEMKEKE